MKRNIVILTAALAMTLTACGSGKREPSATSRPTPTEKAGVPTAVATVLPTATAVPPMGTQHPQKETQQPEETAEQPSPTTDHSTEVTQVPTHSISPTAEPGAEESAHASPTPQTTAEPYSSETAAPPQESGVVLPPEVLETQSPEDPLSTPDTAPHRGAGVPTDVEVLDRYREADTAYRWFTVKALESDRSKIKRVDTVTYAKVTDPRFPTLSSFRAYLKTLFSDEIVDGLLPTDGTRYVDFDGVLYVCDSPMSEEPKTDGITLMVLWPEGEEPVSCTVQAVVELLVSKDGEDPSTTEERIYEFPYQKVGDKWVFTQFESII